MNEKKFKEYLGIANHDIQMANDTMELKSYVASILYEIDELKRQKEELEQYIEMIDDRNSIKLQTVKDDMVKILKKD